MKKIIILFIFSFGLYIPLLAQKPLVGIGTANPQAVLDVVSSNNGILIPRQTASQIESMQDPDEWELAYSVTNNGSMINKKSFWYFRSGSWFPLTGDGSNNENIYTVNGNLKSDRQLSQNGNHLNIGPGLLYVDATTSSVGILTTSPTQAFDINGNIRIRTLNKIANIISDAQGVLMHDPEFFDVGDVKPSLITTDHDGWYLLNGRDVTTLPQIAKDNASNILSITTLLPDATGRYSIGTTSTTGVTSGSSTAALLRANLPNVNLTYTTDAEAAHTHGITYDRIRTNSEPTIHGNTIYVYWLSGTLTGAGPITTASSSTAHNHTFTANSGGSNTPINIQPAALNANYFVYLGQ
ncbi:hypothetical protein A0O34_21265 [Chryseobacterium glaciei]|uniref:Phage tail collar domain-containing protein n=1 Tax=Chryseobacterium glaciei TaxID=1685010 RepID=A0A172Y1G2_9FLAO|nr:hypothetical protein [Chryseobacterium glaciei]ANF52895.1 hypothetical protein A0O34_21265 [Chryseobacterium glaciei]